MSDNTQRASQPPASVSASAAGSAAHGTSPRFSLSTAPDDPAWDAFLADRGASHTQASVWGQVKRSLGWEALRVVARNGDDIVGGVQILSRRLPGLGRAGYVSNGPVLPTPDPELRERLLQEARTAARRHHIRMVTVQPPLGDDDTTARLRELGAVPSSARVSPPATLLLGLDPGPDRLLAQMSSRTRYNVRLAGRRGVVVREGDERDLDVYLRLLRTTAARQAFVPLPDGHFAAMWRLLAPRGLIRLAVAEIGGEPVSAQLAVVFGGTVTNKMSVWSGRHGSDRPNEALQWDTIRWAAASGHRVYDFEGIKLAAARTLLDGDPLPTSQRGSVTSFKLGFGGDVVVLPQALDHVSNPSLRWAYRHVYARIGGTRSLKRLVRRVRTRPDRSPATQGGRP